MRVLFRTHHLRRCNEDGSLAIRTWGANTGRLYRRRIQTMMDVTAFDELFAIRSLRFHPLHGDRAGFFAADLGPQWRLIISRQGDAVVVEEVTNHYGD